MNISSLVAMMASGEAMVGNYDTRKVANDKLPNGLTVSTAMTVDFGYETAIGDDHFHPVERYGDDLELAKAGHSKWLQYAREYNGQELTMLGWKDLVGEEKIVLKTK